ncbi:aminotransferase class V-fold PLP-dependent enzyme [Streptomyces sp. SCSIO ZS0520]|uniref:aminotransferase class V-fold PLP-dependent enzyme n=1 Tax=Streptomyces sp. SCSIO ZS0520 TaxID=2892996 RepID=UPI0039876218
MDFRSAGAQSGLMENLAGSLAGEQFAPRSTYLNTASAGLLPARSVAALHEAAQSVAEGAPLDMFADVEAARAGYARLAQVPVERVAAGSSVATFVGLIATSLPSGAEVLTAEGDFASAVNPFHVRADLKVRTVPLERIAESVRPGTALVAVSAVQSADGRLADLAAIRSAAAAHGARTCIDVSQALGWLAFDAGQYDFTVDVAYKWLLSPRGVGFLTVPEDFGGLSPVFAGWVAGERPFDSCYGPVTAFARSARRFDESPSLLSFTAARHALDLVEEIGLPAIRAHDLALADRFRAGLERIGREPVPAPGSAIVSVPGLGGLQPAFQEAGVSVSDRAGNLRAAFHLYNSAADVDRLLDLLAA